MQVDGLEQWGQLWSSSVREFEALCGYLTMAFVHHLAQQPELLREGPLRADELERLLAPLRDEASVLPLVRRAMAFVRNRRRRYVQQHKRDHRSRAARARYMSAWVANFEIGDYLQGSGAAFARFNQSPCLAEASHEERARIVQEEARFGGRKLGGPGSEAIYGERDSQFFVQSFEPASSSKRTPGEWQAQAQARPRPRVWAVDLNGHFVSAISCVADRDANLLVVIDSSTMTQLFSNPMTLWLFDLAFVPPGGTAAKRVRDEPLRVCSERKRTFEGEPAASEGESLSCSVACFSRTIRGQAQKLPREEFDLTADSPV